MVDCVERLREGEGRLYDYFDYLSCVRTNELQVVHDGDGGGGGLD